MIKIFRLLMCLCGLTTAFSASAAAIVIEQSLDLSKAEYFHNVEHPMGMQATISLAKSVHIAAGDTVDMTVKFLPKQALSIRSAGGMQFLTGWLIQDFDLAEPGTSYFTISDATLTFVNSSGNEVLSLSHTEPRWDGSAHIGPLFMGQFIPAGEALVFSAYRTTFKVDSLQGDQYYAGPFVQFADLGGGEVEQVAIPEPATAILLLTGMTLLGRGATKRFF